MFIHTLSSRLSRCCLPLICFALLPGAWGAGFKAGVGKVDITPGEAVRLAGYASRSKPFETIDSPLFVKGLAVEDEGGAVTVIMTNWRRGSKRNWG